MVLVSDIPIDAIETYLSEQDKMLCSIVILYYCSRKYDGALRKAYAIWKPLDLSLLNNMLDLHQILDGHQQNYNIFGANMAINEADVGDGDSRAIEYTTAPEIGEAHCDEAPEDVEVFEVKRAGKFFGERMHFDALRTVTNYTTYMFIRDNRGYLFEMRAVYDYFLIDRTLAKGENLIVISNCAGKKYSTMHDGSTVERIKDEASVVPIHKRL